MNALAKFWIGFAKETIIAIEKMRQWEKIFDKHMAPAMEQGGEVIAQTAEGLTWMVFASPTGQLADSIGNELVKPTGWLLEDDVTVGVPYAARREFGFSGMTDSIGRHFTYDPAKPYMRAAIALDMGYLEALFSHALEDAMQEFATKNKAPTPTPTN